MSTFRISEFTRSNPLAVVLCSGRNSHVPMVTDACQCGVRHDMDDQTLWYSTRVNGNSENGYEPWCKAHDMVEVIEPAMPYHVTETTLVRERIQTALAARSALARAHHSTWCFCPDCIAQFN